MRSIPHFFYREQKKTSHGDTEAQGKSLINPPGNDMFIVKRAWRCFLFFVETICFVKIAAKKYPMIAIIAYTVEYRYLILTQMT